MSADAVVVLGVLILGYSLLSTRLERGSVTPAMAFAAAGLVVGPSVLNIVDVEVGTHAFKVVAEAALTILLFTEASKLDLIAIVKRREMAVRLLGIGLPLAIVLGTAAAGLLFPALGFWEAAALAIVLAPTDAALGEAVVADRRVPGVVRRSLAAESGLNDGLALPFLIMALAFAEQGAEGGTAGHWIWFTVKTVGISVLVGAAIGFVGARLLKWGRETAGVTDRWAQLYVLTLAILSYAVVDQLDGSGFVSAFVAGIVLGAVAPKIADGRETTADAIGELLAMIVFALFGAAVVWPAFQHLDAQILVYAILSLTVVRLIAVALAFAGTGFSRGTALYVGWFGPRGLASLIFALVIVEEADLPGISTVLQTVAVTVTISIVAHGLTARPGADAYVRAVERLRVRRPNAPELAAPAPD